jgi:hypothetical protein
LSKHVDALQKKALERIGIMEKKMMRAEKEKFEASLRQAAKVKATLPFRDTSGKNRQSASLVCSLWRFIY